MDTGTRDVGPVSVMSVTTRRLNPDFKLLRVVLRSHAPAVRAAPLCSTHLRQILWLPLQNTAQLNSPSLWWTEWDWWMRVGFVLPWRLCGCCWLPQGRGSRCGQSVRRPSSVAAQQTCRLGTTKETLETRLMERSLCFVSELRVTSNGERAVVSSVYDEAVHVHGDGQGLGVGGTVPGTVILKQNTFRFSHQCHKTFSPKAKFNHGGV